MIWNDHSRDVPEGAHAFLSPSQHSFLSYNKDQLFARYKAKYAAAIGTILHKFAKERIKYKIKVTRNDRKEVELELLRNGIPANVYDMGLIFDNFKAYVNDAIGYQLRPEQPLYFSKNCFGTADAIAYRPIKHDSEFTGELRIHDLKTGTSLASMKQLELYAALFHLEYGTKPGKTKTTLCIYQSMIDDDGEVFPEINIEEPEPEIIARHMDTIITMDRWLDSFKGDE